MENAPAVRQGEIVNIEDQAMSIDSLLGQVKLIQDVMSRIMVEDEHYGTIPGTKKPTLYKPGAEKLCLTFRLDPDYEIIREIRDKDFIAYTVKCNLTHIPTGQSIASGIGSCNSRESKYRYRFIEESTGVPVPKMYWDARKKGDNKEMKRLLQIPNYDPNSLRATKIDNEWVIARSEKIENDNPWDLDNTLIKMGCKRALVAAILNATAASDIFTQDLDDMPPEVINAEVVKKTQKSTTRGQTSTPVKDKDKEKVEAQKEKDRELRGKLKDYAKMDNEQYFEVLDSHSAKNAEDVIKYTPEAQEAILHDLAVKFKMKL